MMYYAGMPEAVNTAACARNRSPTVSLNNVTSFECLFNRKPDVSYLKVFGCSWHMYTFKPSTKEIGGKIPKVF